MDVILYNKINKLERKVIENQVIEDITSISGADVPKADNNGYINGETGEFVPTNAGRATDFVRMLGTYKNEVKGSALLYDSYGVAFYDINKSYISGISGNTETSKLKPQKFDLVAPANAAYIRWSFLAEQATLPDDFAVEITSYYDDSNIEIILPWTDVPIHSQNGYINATTGVFESSNAGRSSGFVEIPSNIGGKVNGKAYITSSYGVAFYNASKRFISGYANGSASGYATQFELQIPETAKYMRWSQVYLAESSLKNFEAKFTIPEQVDIVDLSENNRVFNNLVLHANDGSVESHSSWATTDYIPVASAKKISIQTTLYNNNGVAFYDANKNFVFGIKGNDADRTSSLVGMTLRVDIPEGIYYVRATIYKDGNYSVPADFCPLLFNVDKEAKRIVDYINGSTNNGEHYVLILGDSYSKQGLWVEGLKSGLNVAEVVNLGVTGATIKDQQADRTQYPYTDRPTSSGTGNQNTLGSQVQKLKRLIVGEDLDAGEVKIYEDHSPDIVIIEGGMNDDPDNSTKESAYPQQFITQVNNVYYKNASGSVVQGSYHIKPNVETVDRTSFAGSYRHIVEEVLTLFPDAQIFITTASKFNYFVVNPQVYDTIATQQIKCARYCAATVIDWNGEGNINNITDCPKGSGTQADPYTVYGGTKNTSDGLHPNERGGRTYGRLAANVIKQRFSSIGKQG